MIKFYFSFILFSYEFSIKYEFSINIKNIKPTKLLDKEVNSNKLNLEKIKNIKPTKSLDKEVNSNKLNLEKIKNNSPSGLENGLRTPYIRNSNPMSRSISTENLVLVDNYKNKISH